MHNPSEPPKTVERLLIEAIALKRHVAAVYNGSEMLLAPHQLFSRRGALFVSALNTRRAWRSDDERRLGHFKVDGLSAVKVEPSSFEPLPSFDASLPHEDDQRLFSI